MGLFTTAAVVLVPFPFSDLSDAKVRPAIVLGSVGRGDWILCQITSNPYGDPAAQRLQDSDFQTGNLRTVSYARPGKLFTANAALVARSVDVLRPVPFNRLFRCSCRASTGKPSLIMPGPQSVMPIEDFGRAFVQQPPLATILLCGANVGFTPASQSPAILVS